MTRYHVQAPLVEVGIGIHGQVEEPPDDAPVRVVDHVVEVDEGLAAATSRWSSESRAMRIILLIWTAICLKDSTSLSSGLFRS